jgi:hypothetical protein
MTEVTGARKKVSYHHEAVLTADCAEERWDARARPSEPHACRGDAKETRL